MSCTNEKEHQLCPKYVAREDLNEDVRGRLQQSDDFWPPEYSLDDDASGICIERKPKYRDLGNTRDITCLGPESEECFATRHGFKVRLPVVGS